MRNGWVSWVLAVVAGASLAAAACGGSFESDETGGPTDGGAGAVGSGGSGLSGPGGLGGSHVTGGSAGEPTGGSGGDLIGGSGGGEPTGGTGGEPTGGTGGAPTGGSGGEPTGGTGGGLTGGSGGSVTGGSGGELTGGTGGLVVMGGTGGVAGSGGSGGASCGVECTSQGFFCCGAQCINIYNDILNCGHCGNRCPESQPYCSNGTCGPPPCDLGVVCIGTRTCCGVQCCEIGLLCCDVPGPVMSGPTCAEPTAEGTCPRGCLQCICASPDTPIAALEGDQPIASLRVGDLIYSLNQGRIEPVPIRRVNRSRVIDHHVVQVVLATGSVLEISAGHPTADGRSFGDLERGDQLDGVEVSGVRWVPYRHQYTYDILPDSDTGTYFAGGVLIGSTIDQR